MTAIFRPDGPLFRATEQAGGALVAGDAAGKRDHGAGGAGLTMASLSDRKGAFAEVLQAMTFERRAAQAEAS
jgi:hypothetical protein